VKRTLGHLLAHRATLWVALVVALLLIVWATALSAQPAEGVALAAEVSRRAGAKVARTSQRVRNPLNAPEAWAIEVLEQQRCT